MQVSYLKSVKAFLISDSAQPHNNRQIFLKEARPAIHNLQRNFKKSTNKIKIKSGSRKGCRNGNSLKLFNSAVPEERLSILTRTKRNACNTAQNAAVLLVVPHSTFCSLHKNAKENYACGCPLGASFVVNIAAAGEIAVPYTTVASIHFAAPLAAARQCAAKTADTISCPRGEQQRPAHTCGPRKREQNNKRASAERWPSPHELSSKWRDFTVGPSIPFTRRLAASTCPRGRPERQPQRRSPL